MASLEYKAVWTDGHGLEVYKTESPDYMYLHVTEPKFLPSLRPYMALKLVGGLPYPSQDDLQGYMIPTTSHARMNRFLEVFHYSKDHEMAPAVIHPRQPWCTYLYDVIMMEYALLAVLNPQDFPPAYTRDLFQTKTYEEFRQALAYCTGMAFMFRDLPYMNPTLIEYIEALYGKPQCGDIHLGHAAGTFHVHNGEKWETLQGDLPHKCVIPTYSPFYWYETCLALRLQLNRKDPNIASVTYNTNPVPDIRDNFDTVDPIRIVSLDIALHQPIPGTKITKLVLYFTDVKHPIGIDDVYRYYMDPAARYQHALVRRPMEIKNMTEGLLIYRD